jgi:ATP-dependent Clp protease ATP-binding subunit ClpC
VCELVTAGADEPHVERVAVSVEIAEIPPGEPVAEVELARRVAAMLDGVALPGQVTRRYQPGPSPLVRDAVRGYRTGRLDRVLAGGFDLFAA